MAIKCINFDAHLAKQWDDYVLKNSHASVYHSTSWLNIISEVFKYKDCSVLAMDNNEICGVMPLYQARLGFRRVLVTMPLRDRGGILADNQLSADELTKHALASMHSLACDGLIIKQYEAFMWNMPPQLSLQQPLVTISVSLRCSQADIWNNITPQAKNKVRQAEKNGIRVKLSIDKTDLDMFFVMLYRTRKRLGVPPFPKQFFDRIHAEIISRGQGIVAIAMHNDKPVAGMMLFTFGKSVIDAYSAWNKELGELRANDLLVWKAIEWSKQNHFETFEFGADSPDQDTLLKYKAKWSPEIKPVNYYVACRENKKINLLNGGSISFGIVRKAIGFAPAALYRLSGKVTPYFYC